MNKAELITWLAGLAEDSRQIRLVRDIANGGAQEVDEVRFSLKEVGRRVGKHPVWLSKLGVPEKCGERLGGRRSYKLSRVIAYLGSDACQERLAQLRQARRERDRKREAA